MVRKAIGLTLLIILIPVSANSASLKNVSAENLRSYLAELIVVAHTCSELNVRDYMQDIVWDVLELKTGKSSEDEKQKDLLAYLIDKHQASAKRNPVEFCKQAMKRYGRSGALISDIVYLKD